MRKNGHFVKCAKCQKEFYTVPSLLKKGRGKFCSASCRSKVVVYAMLAVRGESWRRKARKSLSKLHKMVQEDETKHPRWKGKNVGYYGIHDWLTKHFGQPLWCEICHLNDTRRKYHWANLSHKYLRERSDYKRMCVSCHRKYDYAARRKIKELETP